MKYLLSRKMKGETEWKSCTAGDLDYILGEIKPIYCWKI